MSHRFHAHKGRLLYAYAEQLMHRAEFKQAEKILTWQPLDQDNPSTLEKLTQKRVQSSKAKLLRFTSRFEKAFQILRPLLKPDSTRERGFTRTCTLSLINLCLELDKVEDSQTYLKEYGATVDGRKDPSRLKLRLAEFLLSQECYNQAETHFEDVLNQAKKVGIKSIQASIGLARVAHMQNS